MVCVFICDNDDGDVDGFEMLLAITQKKIEAVVVGTREDT